MTDLARPRPKVGLDTKRTDRQLQSGVHLVTLRQLQEPLSTKSGPATPLTSPFRFRSDRDGREQTFR